MAVIRNERKFRFTVVPNDPLRAANLTLQAKGLLALMLSFPDDWSYNLTHLEGLSKNKRDAHRSALRELIEAGYAEWRTLHNSDGTLKGRELVVTDVPFARGTEKASDGDRGTDNPADGATVGRKNRRSGKPSVGKSDTTKTVVNKEPLDEEHHHPESETPAVTPPDDDDLTPHQRWKKNKPPDKLHESRLASHHPGVWDALTELGRVCKVQGTPIIAAWSRKVCELVDAHGDAAVAEALQRTSLKPNVDDRFAYFLKVITSPKRAARGEPDYREVSAAEFLEGSWN